MRCPDKVTALHPLTHRVDFAHAPRCVFSFTSLRPKYVSFVLLSNLKSHRSSLTTHYSNPHNNVPSAACPAASTLICVVRALLYNVTVALPSLSSIMLGFQ